MAMTTKLRAFSTLLILALLAGCAASRPAPDADLDLFVVRHGQAWSNLKPEERGGRTGDQMDALTPAGVAQIEALAKQIEGADVGGVFHSPRVRTRQTAEILAKSLGLPWVELADLAPMADGEQPAAAATRALRALARRPESGAWVVVSHSGVTACVIGEAYGTEPGDRVKVHKLSTGGMQQLRWHADGSLAGK